jgi:hypothetical protein
MFVVNNLIKALDQGHVGALMMHQTASNSADLSAAFVAVDPPVRKDFMLRRFGVCGKAFNCRNALN